ncbi:MAG: hypothetical protein A2X86_01265 [Bdellovibrionales bacterium GWA2_49_15]|nr:MAG: hypothetical protein A2X86_01265 [Bdellovibrionales bacterium GWA2_49_15]HAZ12146.1 hypothetical protein [Bdellovibrionales bacterium]
MKKVIAALIILPLLSWSIWQYLSQPIVVEEDAVAEISSSIQPLERQLSPAPTTRAPQKLQHFEEKLERLEEKYMGRLEILARLLEAHHLQGLSIGDDMPHNLPGPVEDAWKSYLTALTQLEKLKAEEHEIEEDFIKMAHQGISLTLIESAPN